jgi:mRNA interferase RelE/StbE
MTPKSKPGADLSRTARDDLKRLPGNVYRQMVVAIDGLEQNPRPPGSKRLALVDERCEARRLRLGHWRIIYLVVEGRALILAIRRRPPYDYDDLEALIEAAE